MLDTGNTTTSIISSLDQLEKEICELNAHITAATGRFLALVAEYDRREGWLTWECRSMAHWLSWKCGIGLNAAREYVRVARALEDLPAMAAALCQGEMSYSKARALTRVATPASEGALVELSRSATASHLETFVRHYRRVDADEAEARHEARSVTYHHEDGMLVLQARLETEEAAVLLAALNDATFRLAAGSQPEKGVTAVTPCARRADALVAVAESYLATGMTSRSGGERTMVTLRADADALVGGEGLCGIEGGGSVSVETAQRLSCDASVVLTLMGSKGEPLDVGRRSRTFPTAIRRALELRDQYCVYPGCTNRIVDGHHIVHWIKGGSTSLDNGCLLCRLCRRRHKEHYADPLIMPTRARLGGVKACSPRIWSA
ncbi:MAG: HNH endonuclease [Actinomycetota bacterium]|nr:HNH endonuclease [Actinomycetota bacterium]